MIRISNQLITYNERNIFTKKTETYRKFRFWGVD